MDYRIKVIENGPARSVIDAVRRAKTGSTRVNGITFGESEKFGGVVSAPINARRTEPFRRVPGYLVIDADSGTILSEPHKIVLPTPNPNSDQNPKKIERPARDTEAMWLERFIYEYQNADELTRAGIGRDRFKRALRAAGIPFEVDADNHALRAQFDAHLAARQAEHADVSHENDAQHDDVPHDDSWLEDFLERFQSADENARQRIVNDDYRDALKHLGVAHNANDPKATLIDLLEAYLADHA